MIRRLTANVLVAVAAMSLLSSVALEANLTTAANITGLAAAALPLIALVTAAGYGLARLSIHLARGGWRIIRHTTRGRT